MSAPLTDAELQSVTGKRQHAAQARFLRKIGLNPIVRDDGFPVVTWEAVNAVLLGQKGKPELQLNLRAIGKAA